MSNKIEFNSKFKLAYDSMQDSNKCLFITGKAGTGKSTLLHYYCQHASTKPVVLAPTGVAALNVNGQTIHSFFYFSIDVTPQKIKDKIIKPRAKKIYKTLKTIIIDEVSMLRADLLDCIDMFLRIYGPEPNQPFGGVQMIFVGDLQQLPPVVTSDEKELFSKHYLSPYFFSANALRHINLEIIELNQVYRQKEQKFIDLLNKFRNLSVTPNDLQLLNTRFKPDFIPPKNEFYINLTTTNRKADEINESQLDRLKSDEIVSKAEILGNFSKEYYPTAENLFYKIGAQIMLLNNDPKKRWVNGSIAIIEDVAKDKEGKPIVIAKLQDSERVVPIQKFAWEVFKFKAEGKQIISEPIGTFMQFPFRLAWAVTIHKSQGKTFEKVIIDIHKGTFASGQLYVALSRCTSFEGLILKVPIQAKHIKTDIRVNEFLLNHPDQKIPDEEKISKKINFIQAAIRQNFPLELTYQKLDNTITNRVVIPKKVDVHQYHSNQFQGLQAFCLIRQDIRVFKISKILDLKLATLT